MFLFCLVSLDTHCSSTPQHTCTTAVHHCLPVPPPQVKCKSYAAGVGNDVVFRKVTPRDKIQIKARMPCLKQRFHTIPLSRNRDQNNRMREEALTPRSGPPAGPGPGPRYSVSPGKGREKQLSTFFFLAPTYCRVFSFLFSSFSEKREKKKKTGAQDREDP